ncbi:peptidase S16 lon domain protein [Parasphaerochaeta coccoides DSM 17374]|uniref:endopeptidase La n=2 Tax=Parasphaerochaeta TaxID=3062336 RepID=F4GJV9_PARC1|nr:peptidase S16 lon domain protein [Parasphaerochaeta coccoides DSM 17374]
MGVIPVNIKELSFQEAAFSYPPSIARTPLPAVDSLLVGQPRASRALAMGMAVEADGYNIFVSGEPGSGRHTAVRMIAQQLSHDTRHLKDIVYVHCFDVPDSPSVVLFSPGTGEKFLAEMKNLAAFLRAAERNGEAETEDSTASFLKETDKLIDSAVGKYPETRLFLERVRQTIHMNPKIFVLPTDDDKEERETICSQCLPNLVVNRAGQDKRPFVEEPHPSYANVFGAVSPADGKTQLPHQSVKAGSLLQASGGFWVATADDILSEPNLWEALKRFLAMTTFSMKDGNAYGLPVGSLIRPEPVPLPVKIILIGSEETYDKLCESDASFLKLFKISAQFDYSMPATEENITGTIAFLRRHVEEKKLLPPDDAAIAETLRFSAWHVEHRGELTTQLSFLGDLLQEADYWARFSGEKEITAPAVITASNERDYISSVMENRITQEIISGEMVIALTGSKIGVVNGLAVMDRGLASFGTPAVITATVAPGNEGIVNIEHEAGLSGEIHDKGLLILEGYLRKRYARTFPLSLYAGICFEQSYAEVDGDSASSSELFALLSAIGEIPLRQDIAVTGSVNQMGEIQPVGGINEKIGGFFSVCQKMGLTGHQGVIIPRQNISALVLPYAVLDAIAQHTFHLYPIETIDEGMEILTNRIAGEQNAKGTFPVNSANKAIEDRLRKLYELSKTGT